MLPHFAILLHIHTRTYRFMYVCICGDTFSALNLKTQCWPAANWPHISLLLLFLANFNELLAVQRTKSMCMCVCVCLIYARGVYRVWQTLKNLNYTFAAPSPRSRASREMQKFPLCIGNLSISRLLLLVLLLQLFLLLLLLFFIIALLLLLLLLSSFGVLYTIYILWALLFGRRIFMS